MGNIWNRPGVPHLGWWCSEVEDTGDANHSCQMCSNEAIRYVHHMMHANYPHPLQVGCICAGKMEGDYEAPKERERGMRSRTARREKWLDRKWKITAKGNGYRLKSKGEIFTVTLAQDGTYYGGVFANDRWQNPPGRYAHWHEAALAVFDMRWPPKIRFPRGFFGR